MWVPSINLSAESGWIAPLAVITASLLGSAHCLGMCGGLVALFARDVKQLGAYHLGRLTGYVALGATAGFIGEKAFPTQWGGWIAAFLMAGVFLLVAIRQVYGGKELHLVPEWFSRAVQKGMTRFIPQAAKHILPASVVGLLSTGLPCGWLHTFVLAAVATRSPLSGGVTLFLFWLGTLPALTLGPKLVSRLLSPLGARRVWMASFFLGIAAMATLWIKIGPLIASNSHGGVPSCHCHETER